MKCPLCEKEMEKGFVQTGQRMSWVEKEMEKGFVQTGQRMSWVKQKHKASLIPQEGEVLLGNNVFSGLSFEAYICKSCKKIVLDYDGADYHEG